MKAEKIIKVDNYYAAILDYYSPSNKTNLMMSLMDKARLESRNAKKDWATLYYFNYYLSELSERKELISWLLLFYGIYKVQVELSSRHKVL